ncbi:MAG TPA: HlyD family efflux transporter periplasmic adaptor subunit [Kofleriaceae bacterium]|nr:HlyD family efflux transporter periplasmic adaptor subunit [Kofleriaceae bacterium]
MIKNAAWLVAVIAGAAACHKADLTDGRYQGMIEYEARDLSFEQPGRVIDVSVHRGQRITAGTPIAKQDDTLDKQAKSVDARAVAVAQADLDLIKAGSRAEDVRAAEAQLTSAKAAEKNAQIELGRQRTLVEKGALPAAGLDLLEAQLAAATGTRQAQEEKLRALRKGARGEEIDRAQARVAQATEALALDDKRIEKRAITAPADGVVQDVYLQAGELAGAGVPILSLVDTKKPYADVFVPVPDAPKVAIGDAATLKVEGLDTEAHGTVELIYPEAEFTPRFVFSPRERPNLMVRVRVRLEDPQGALHAGLPAYVTFGGAK